MLSASATYHNFKYAIALIVSQKNNKTKTFILVAYCLIPTIIIYADLLNNTLAFNLLSFSAVIDNHIKTGLDFLCARPQALQWEAYSYKSIRHNPSMHPT